GKWGQCVRKGGGRWARGADPADVPRKSKARTRHAATKGRTRMRVSVQNLTRSSKEKSRKSGLPRRSPQGEGGKAKAETESESDRCDPSGVVSFYHRDPGVSFVPLTRNSSTPGYVLATLRVATR